MAKKQTFAEKAKGKVAKSEINVKVVKTVKTDKGNYKFQESFVKLEIINAIGERINLLEDGIKSSGIYESVWNAQALPSGIYFYRLQAVPIVKQTVDPSTGSGQSFVETKKMILLK